MGYTFSKLGGIHGIYIYTDICGIYTLIGLRFDDSMVSELILECHKYLGKYGNISYIIWICNT